MKPSEGAASSWANFRSATFLMLAKRGQHGREPDDREHMKTVGPVTDQCSRGRLGFSLTASKEYSKYNIKINLFSPGYIKTEMQPRAKTNPQHSVKYLKVLLDPKKNLFTGKFLWTKYTIPLTSDLKKINWSKGKAPKKFLTKT